jgi:hypothetical protein
MSAAVVEYACRKPANERLPMALFGAQRRLANALHSKVRLIVPADPGPERLLAAVQLYDPGARRDGDRISVASGSVLLTAPTEIDAETGRRAPLPAGLSVVYFVDVPEWRGSPAQVTLARDAKRQAMDSAVRLIGGLAARLGGIAVPAADETAKPLHADVYTTRQVPAADLAGLLSRQAPGLAPVQAPSSSDGAVTLRGGNAPFEVESWPADNPLMTMDPPIALGTMAGGLKLCRITVRAAQPAEGADPGIARLVGEAGLAVAEATGGMCVDLFGFRVTSPEDLVIR